MLGFKLRELRVIKYSKTLYFTLYSAILYLRVKGRPKPKIKKVNPMKKLSATEQSALTNELVNLIENEDVTFLDNDNDIKQHLDDIVTVFFGDRDVENNEDGLCDFLGLDNFHRVRDAQNESKK